MNQKEIYLSFVLFALAFVVLLVTLNPYRSLSNTSSAQPTPIPVLKYTCPASEWVDCMPGPGPTKTQCQPDYLSWAKINCPNFKGAAL